MIDPAAPMVTAFATNQIAEPSTESEYRGMDLAMTAYEGLAA